MELLNGQELANKIIEETKQKIAKMRRIPKLAIIFADNDSGDLPLFIKLKVSAAEKIGVEVELTPISFSVTTEELVDFIEKLNKDLKVDAILIQMPFDENINIDVVLNSIVPEKDIDGLSEEAERPPAAAAAIVRLLESYQIKIKNAKIAVLGDGRLVGAPVKGLLRDKGAQVKGYGGVLHLRGGPGFAGDSSEVEAVSSADIVILATGQSGIIGVEDIKDGAVVIDCGNTEKTREFKYSGEMNSKLSAISPVPGGVGPLTIACLLERLAK